MITYSLLTFVTMLLAFCLALMVAFGDDAARDFRRWRERRRAAKQLRQLARRKRHH